MCLYPQVSEILTSSQRNFYLQQMETTTASNNQPHFRLVKHRLIGDIYKILLHLRFGKQGQKDSERQRILEGTERLCFLAISENTPKMSHQYNCLTVFLNKDYSNDYVKLDEKKISQGLNPIKIK